METFTHIFSQMFQLFKNKFILMLHIIAAFLLPIQPLIVLVGLMIMLDTATGLWKAKKLKESITSHKLSRIISKMVLYQIGIITFFILEKFILGEFVVHFTSIPFFLTKIVAMFFVGIELISINENVAQVTKVNFFKSFRKILFRVKGVKDTISDIGRTDDYGYGRDYDYGRDYEPRYDDERPRKEDEPKKIDRRNPY